MENTQLISAEQVEVLKNLYWELSIAKASVAGVMGAASMFPHDFLNSDVDVITEKRTVLVREQSKDAGQSRWRMNSEKKASVNRREKWINFLDLLEGFKVTQSYLDSLDSEERAALLEVQKTYSRSLTPKQAHKNAKSKLEEIQGKKAMIAGETDIIESK